jgi:dienelactone hydrolase
VVALGHLGVGDSTPEVCDRITIDDIAAANNLAVQKISELLSDGAAADGYPPVNADRRIGIGQSMGGGVTVIMAANHRTYDGIAVLGYSAIHTVLPLPDAAETHTVAAQMTFSSARTLHELPNDAPQRTRLWDRLIDWYPVIQSGS